MSDRYAAYTSLKIDYPSKRILRLTFDRPETYNSVDAQTHTQLTHIWRDINNDPDISAVIVTGAGKAFSAGGDFELIKSILDNPSARMATWKEAKDLVYNVINCNKPIISAINGVAVGAGLVVGIQDLGGAGLTCATSETASRGGVGMDVYVSEVPQREPGMEPFEVMTSESQERMLAIVTPENLDEVMAIAEKWEVRASVVGTVTGSEQEPRLVRALGYDVEIVLEPLMLFVVNDDRPGRIGRIGTLFGEAGVNIANMAVSRTNRGGKALMAISLDTAPEPDLVEALRAAGLDDVYLITLGAD